MPATTNYGWTLPTPTGDRGAWGAILNTAFQSVDTKVKLAETTAGAALPKAGGTMTGRADLKTATVASAAITTGALDLAVAGHFVLTPPGTVALSFANVPAAGRFCAVILDIVAGLGKVTFPGVKWGLSSGNVAPTLSAFGTDRIVLTTHDGGTTWLGVVVETNYL